MKLIFEMSSPDFSSVYDIDFMNQNIVKDLMNRHKGLNSSIIYYALQNNSCCFTGADLELRERKGHVLRKRSYTRPPRIEQSDKYIALQEIDECIDDVLAGTKLLIIMRGLPGSGKSFLSRSILKACRPNANPTQHIHSADQFFMVDGVYMFDPVVLSAAHEWNQRNVDRKMSLGFNPIIVDNTNTQLWEMRNYLGMAVKYKYKIRILDMSTRWSLNLPELFKRNKHNVPKKHIEKMMLRYEMMGITGEQLLKFYKFSLDNCSPTSQPTKRRSRKRSSTKKLENNKEGSSSDGSDRKSSEHSPEGKQRNEVTEGKAPAESTKPKFEFFWDTKTNSIIETWTPLNTPKSINIVNEEKKPDTCESGTNTCIADIHVESETSKFIYGRCREINSGKQMVSYKSGMLDKSCSTQNDEVCSDRNEDLKKLTDVFPNIPPIYIRDIYDDCKGNFDMTFEIFLEDNKDYSHLSFTPDNVISNTTELQQQETEQEIKKYASEESLNQPSTSAQETYKKGRISSPDYTSEDENTRDSPTSDSDSDQSNAQSNESLENDSISLNIGQFMVEQLEKEFGHPSHNWPVGFQPVVQVPKALARQLYTFYVESIYQQMDTQKCILESMVKEDEAFAKKLYEEEIGNYFEVPTPVEGLKEIMNEQAAMKIQQKELPKLKTPNDLASLLTQKKLCEAFPRVDKKLILEVYHANDFNYQQTVDDLLSSLGMTGVINSELREPPITQSTLQELKKAQEDTEQYKGEKSDKTAEEYRHEADFHLRKRQELRQKAQEYYSKGQTEVAMFYSELVKKQTQYYDDANNKAACLLLDKNSRSLNNINAIDLHSLYVKEAISALDMFLDSRIAELTTKKSRKHFLEILVITGRGNRSVNGVPKIRPAVIRRLIKRGVKFQTLNPGVLKVKVNKCSRVTNDFKEKGGGTLR